MTGKYILSSITCFDITNDKEILAWQNVLDIKYVLSLKMCVFIFNDNTLFIYILCFVIQEVCCNN